MKKLLQNYRQHKMIYWMTLPVILYFLIFHYVPMFGILMAFQNYKPALGLLKSEWVGFQHFINFFQSDNFFRVIKNTLVLSIYDLIFAFPAPIILALLLNEVHNKPFKKTVQTISYLPYFLSMVVICGIIRDFTASNGPITAFVTAVTGKTGNLLSMPEMFRPIFITTNIWQMVGYNSIIYLAALSQIDDTQYEEAVIDGAGYWKQCLHVTLPGIAPTIIIMLILRVGQLMSVNFEKVLLLYNQATYETSDVISTYVYRQGIINYNYGYSTAVGLFNSVIGFILIVTTNTLSKKVTETSLF